MILLRVGASAGALLSPEIARDLRAAGRTVVPVVDEAASMFVGPAAFGGHAGHRGPEPAEALVHVPATAETLARLANGLDGEPAGGPPPVVVVVPDLDAGTAGHPAVQENLRRLRGDGAIVVGEGGAGMASAGEVVTAVLGALDATMRGMRVVVTAGGTREPIDGVRFVGNRSTGKMGRAVAREAARMGADVRVVAANIGEREPGVGWVEVETVEELESAVLEAVEDADALIMAAAVSDFKPAGMEEGKIRRSGGTLSLEFEPTPDVLKGVAARYPELYVVGFAATYGDPAPDAREKLGRKGVDLVVGNDISGTGIGFGSEENEVYLVSERSETFVPRAAKTEVARRILEVVAAEAAKKRGGVGR